MKKTFLTLAAIYMLSTANTINAQIAMNDGKQLIALTSHSGGDDENVNINNINLRAVKDFKKHFATASNETWVKVSDGFIASFTLDDVQIKTAYSKKGNWTYTIREYYEKQLPVDVRAIVKRTYYDYTITKVEEVHVNDKVNYLIHMNDAATWKIVRVCDNEMELVQDRDKR